MLFPFGPFFLIVAFRFFDISSVVIYRDHHVRFVPEAEVNLEILNDR